jgi:hypothetical protein
VDGDRLDDVAVAEAHGEPHRAVRVARHLRRRQGRLEAALRLGEEAARRGVAHRPSGQPGDEGAREYARAAGRRPARDRPRGQVRFGLSRQVHRRQFYSGARPGASAR